ncbi:hypothetical protein CANTEDRAFT_93152 [Yamadazyma tenuis ATCC 10573]|uniref:Uncharacterized protein n=1 Tax=Candida tenuis (strain ATCC 10573 / BCRC 21748 / CBS 615 / JCM 9827 / NBRC 10315 / NRRL Y-1498 / VKM Y-70) TaxID=590646 RepID=G3B1A1_CANTC|nr:uncharacterized protein CANTEDRAFT_93152 [Yamadazyma tenuis ATCC 10573]EGV64919.1 hypothetical protein CANTEDRAFT_93152 [Yamadazyma tenuis ATCC 10573]
MAVGVREKNGRFSSQTKASLEEQNTLVGHNQHQPVKKNCPLIGFHVRDSNNQWVKRKLPSSTTFNIVFSSQPTFCVRTVIGKPSHIVKESTPKQAASASKDAAEGKYSISEFDDNIDPRFQYFAYHYEHHAQYIIRCDHGCFHLRSLRFKTRQNAEKFFNNLLQNDINLTPRLIKPGDRFQVTLGELQTWLSNPSMQFLWTKVSLDLIEDTYNSNGSSTPDDKCI